jgi:hypothetical protein
LLQKARVFMRERVQKHPFISDYAPVPHWGGVMEDLVIRFDNALGMLKQGDFDAMQRWAGRLQDIPRGFGESNMNWLSPADQDAFMQMLNSTYSICRADSKVKCNTCNPVRSADAKHPKTLPATSA